jgi:hypothetical protein
MQAERPQRTDMSTPTKPATEAALDPIEQLAEKLYVAMCAHIYSASGEKAKAKASVNLDAVQIDFGAVGKPK